MAVLLFFTKILLNHAPRAILPLSRNKLLSYVVHISALVLFFHVPYFFTAV